VLETAPADGLRTPLIYVTLHSNFESCSRSIMSGGNDLIAKPIFPIELAVKVVSPTWRIGGGKLRKGLKGNESIFEVFTTTPLGPEVLGA